MSSSLHVLLLTLGGAALAASQTAAHLLARHATTTPLPRPAALQAVVVVLAFGLSSAIASATVGIAPTPPPAIAAGLLLLHSTAAVAVIAITSSRSWRHPLFDLGGDRPLAAAQRAALLLAAVAGAALAMGVGRMLGLPAPAFAPLVLALALPATWAVGAAIPVLATEVVVTTLAPGLPAGATSLSLAMAVVVAHSLWVEHRP